MHLLLSLGIFLVGVGIVFLVKRYTDYLDTPYWVQAVKFIGLVFVLVVLAAFIITTVAHMIGLAS